MITHAMARKKTTVYLEEDLLRAAKVRAAREGKKEYQVFEEALGSYLGFEALLERVWARSDLSEEEAMELAVREQHAYRRERARKGKRAPR